MTWPEQIPRVRNSLLLTEHPFKSGVPSPFRPQVSDYPYHFSDKSRLEEVKLNGLKLMKTNPKAQRTIVDAVMTYASDAPERLAFRLFITHMMEATNKDVKLVMEWSGHNSLESFKIYLHPSKEGRILGSQCVDSVALF